VSLAQSGELVVWSQDGRQSTLPASLSGVAVSQVVLPMNAGLALTADGRVVGWGANLDRLQQVPAAVAATKVAQIATTNLHAGAVTRDGRVLMWGRKMSNLNPLDVPSGLRDVAQLAVTANAAIALKRDGSVVAWGRNLNGITDVPAGLKATAVVAGSTTAYALTDEGTLVRWGNNATAPLPAAVQQPGNVKAIAAAANGALALLADDTLVSFDGALLVDVPSEVQGRGPLLLANGGDDLEFAIVDRDRAIHHWMNLSGGPDEVPSDLDGRPITHIALGPYSGGPSTTGGVVIQKMLRAELPQVRGSVRVGAVLTGVPGTFSDEPDSVQSQWLVGGAPVPGAGSSLAVTAAMVGKSITYRSTASKTGESPVSSSSAGVTVPPVVVPPVASSTKIVKVVVAKKAAKVTVTAKVRATRPATGKAVVTIKKGKKVIVSKTVNVPASGAAKLTVGKFSKLVVKKTKAKGKKAKTAHRGKYTVSVKYLGNKQVKPSAGSGKFTVKR